MDQENLIPPPRPHSNNVSTRIVPCKSCSGPIDDGDRFCRHCGRRQKRGVGWYYHPVSILILGFLVVGPLALPLVWLSPQMGRKAKVAVATAISIYSIFVIYSCYRVIMLVVGLWSQFLDPTASFG